MYTFASLGFGFRMSNVSKNNKDILCIRQNHVLVEFLRTINQQWRLALEFILDLNFHILSNYFYFQFFWVNSWILSNGCTSDMDPPPPDPYHELIGYIIAAYRIAHTFSLGFGSGDWSCNSSFNPFLSAIFKCQLRFEKSGKVMNIMLCSYSVYVHR